MVLFLQVFLAFALGLAVSFAFRVMFCAYTPNNVAGTTEAGHVGEEQKRKVRCKEPPSFSGEQDMFSPLHPYTHRTQRLVWVPWCDSRNRASQYQIEADRIRHYYNREGTVKS